MLQIILGQARRRGGGRAAAGAAGGEQPWPNVERGERETHGAPELCLGSGKRRMARNTNECRSVLKDSTSVSPPECVIGECNAKFAMPGCGTGGPVRWSVADTPKAAISHFHSPNRCSLITGSADRAIVP